MLNDINENSNKSIIKEALNRIKESFQTRDNQKKYILILVILIIINILIINIFFSFAYYEDKAEFPILQVTVGDIYSTKFDYTLLVYIEEVNIDGIGSGNYRLTDSIPINGYTYSGYKCRNNSVLTYDDVLKTTSVTIKEKETCSIYFNLINPADIVLNIMLEKDYNTDKYELTTSIPTSGYTYSHFDCLNNGNISYNSSLNTISLSSTTRDYCNVYFKKDNT